MNKKWEVCKENKNDIDKNIEGIKLTRTLKTILENK